MPAPFKRISTEQFAELLSKFPFTRKINAVHMHHTWKPNRAQYRGHDTIVAMWRFHTETNHWSDIAQHISIAPDGSIWLGRDWNRPPASASGHNGNPDAGPFMFEMIGNFDHGMDPFDGPQRDTAIEVIARVQQHFGLPSGSLQLHNMMSTKSCPGTSIDYQDVLKEVDKLRIDLLSGSRNARSAGEQTAHDEAATRKVVREAVEDLLRSSGRAADPFDAEPCTHGDGVGEQAQRGTARGGIRFDADDRDAMRPHIINLRMGQFSDSGDWTTSAADVKAIFNTYLPAALKEARERGRPLRVMFYAHGGLTGEADALIAARARIDWWKSNGIYPIYFIWETGIGEVLGQMLERFQQGRSVAPRNVFSDHVSDPLIEALARRTVAVQKIWSAMKWSAQQSSAIQEPAGAALFVAQQLAAFCKANPEGVQLHATGHSAGAIFHAHFIPCALARGVPRFDSLHLLAPALRVDLFRNNLAAFVGPRQGIDNLTVYTMADSFEKEDNCGGVYRKSLLYLVYRSLEPERDQPILGLERCLRDDDALQALFGLNGGPKLAEVVWSDNGLASGRSASRSRTHGGFDDDPATMGSVVRRVLGRDDADRIVELPLDAGSRGADPWHAKTDEWAEEWADEPSPAWAGASSWRPEQKTYAAPPPSTATGSGSGTGRRLALCVGIDAYPTAPLGGCVNDARAWASAFANLGFAQPRMLLDREATADGIVRELSALVSGSRPGDVIVFQYAGHGTQVPDLDGDEAGGDTAGEDEALCPYDFASGELLIDDDMRAIFARLPDGVNLTCFFDCCHSGTITRMALGGRPGGMGPSTRARFVRADRQLIDAYTSRRHAGWGRVAPSRAAPSGGAETMREIVFSACLSSEVALENDGHGDFTRRALQVLGQGQQGLSNGSFADLVTEAFGQSPRQHAKLYSSDAGRALALLQPLRATQAGPGRGPGSGPTRQDFRQGERRGQPAPAY